MRIDSPMWRRNILYMGKLKQRRRWFLREWRKHRNLSQEQLAERISATQGFISHLETGKADYTGEMLEKLADALNCGPGDLLMRNPLNPDNLWSIWDQAKPGEAVTVVVGDRAQTVVKATGT